MNKQQILFEKKSLLLIDKYQQSENNELCDERYIATILKNIESLGFTLDVDLIGDLRKLNQQSLTEMYRDLVEMCKVVVGGNLKHEPFYPNFPQQVMEASEAELYIRAVLHYVFGAVPDTEIVQRLPLIDNPKLKVISKGNEEDFNVLVSNLIDAKTSVSEWDKNIIESALISEKNVEKLLPREIKLKENLGFVIGVLRKHKKITDEIMVRYFKTATDVLRYLVELSGGDVSLREKTKFVKLKRSDRILILSMLEKMSNVAEDMLRYQSEWVKIGEIIHPGEYRKRFPKATYGFDVVRGNVNYETFNAKVETAIKNGQLETALDYLIKRPGELARRLDKLLRIAESKNRFMAVGVLSAFEEVATKVSTPVLIQVLAHFKGRNNNVSKTREFFPKGKISKIWIEENKMGKMSEVVCERVVKICEEALKEKFSSLEKMGKVYLEESLKNCVIPFSQRSASKSLKMFAKGSKFDIEESAKVLRLFLYWQDVLGENGESIEDVDIDLSVALIGEEFDNKGYVSYSNKRDITRGIYHSGDYVEAPNGVSEYIDIDIEKALSNGVRYIAMTAHSFNYTRFCDLPYCFVGWMERENLSSGEVFEEKTVRNKIDISSNMTTTIPLVFDLKERKVVWLDLMMEETVSRYDSFAVNNIESNLGFIGAITKSMVQINKMDLYELFKLHVEARGGEFVEEKEKADLIFSIDEGITPHDFDVIAAEYLV